jgi:hypothetical protein
MYRTTSVNGPYASMFVAKYILAKIQELNDDGWIIVKEVDNK